MSKSFILEDHSKIQAGNTYYIKAGESVKDIILNVKTIEEKNGEKVLILETEIPFNGKKTYEISLFELEEKTIIQIDPTQMEIPKKEFVDYLYIITNIINLKGLPTSLDKKNKEVNKYYWLCTVNGERYIVNKKKFREYVKIFYKTHFNVVNNHFLSTSSELFKTTYQLDYYSFLPVKDVTKRVNSIKKRNKTRSEIDDYLHDKFKNLYYENESWYGIDYKSKTPSEKNQYDLLKESLCKYVFSLSSQNVMEYIENIKNPSILYKKYKDSSIIPIFIQCTQFVHYDKNMCRLLYKSYPFVNNDILNISTGYVAFNVYFCDIDFSSLSEENKQKVFELYDIKTRYNELIKSGITRDNIFFSLLEENIDTSLLQYINLNL